MCGIAGYIGPSKNNEISFELLSKIFQQNESRGIDASGFWGFDSSQQKVYTYKEPTRSSNFIKQDFWKSLTDNQFDIIVTHARGASKGYGDPLDNRNNHPFLSENNAIALIHNGRIEEHEYAALKEKYQLETNCDSEILLRLFECESDYELNYQESRLESLHEIFSSINHGHMAVAIGEIYKDTSNLWLFRNRHRPLWISDLRHNLGQFFFFSDPDLWINVIDSMSSTCKKFLGKQIFTQINPEQIYHFNLSPEKSLVFDKFSVIRTSNFEPWIYNGNLLKKIYDNRLQVQKIIKEQLPDDSSKTMDEIRQICGSLNSTNQAIISLIKNNKLQDKLSNNEMSEILDCLKDQLHALKNIETILNG